MRPEVTIYRKLYSRRAALTLGLGALAAVILTGAGPAMAANSANSAKISTMKPDAAHKAALAGEIILIDIRTPGEWLETKVGDGAIGLDMREKNFVPTLVMLRRANPDKPIALICRTGNRTGYVTTTLASQGFPGLIDVNEGMQGGPNGPGWLKRGLPTYDGTLTNVAARRSALLP